MEKGESGNFKELEEERCILKKVQDYRKNKNASGLGQLLQESKSKFKMMTNTRTAKIVRSCIEFLIDIPKYDGEKEKIIMEWIDWAVEEKRVFLRIRIQLCLATLYFQIADYNKMKNLLIKLLKEVKKLDDKRLMVEIHMLESECYLRLLDLPKARASVTSARMESNVIYISPVIQAKLDYLTGMLYSQERDYKTAYSYFFEAYESYHHLSSSSNASVEGLITSSSQSSPSFNSSSSSSSSTSTDSSSLAAVIANQSLSETDIFYVFPLHFQATHTLKMVALCKIMLEKPEDVLQLIQGKVALRYNNSHIHAILAIAQAMLHRSLDEFSAALQVYPTQLVEDFSVQVHLKELNDGLFEKHLLKLIEPFSHVEINFLASKIKMKEEDVEIKLGQMILDKKLNGTLDQDTHCLTVSEDTGEEQLYSNGVSVMDSLNRVLDAITLKATLIK